VLTLETKDNKTEFAPGAVVEGTVGWQLPQPPRDALLKLIWYTEGKGTQDVGIVERLELPVSQSTARNPFRFQLPPGPYSCSGRLVSVKWALELLVDRSRHVQRIELLVSPWEKEPVLEAFTGEPH